MDLRFNEGILRRYLRLYLRMKFIKNILMIGYNLIDRNNKNKY